MDIVCDRDLAFLRYDQPRSDAFGQDDGETGSTAASTVDTACIRLNYGYIITMAGCTPYLPFLHYHIFGVQKQDCMNFSVQVKVMPLKELLDPQGKAVLGGLQNLGIKTVQDVRIGKTIQLQLEAASADEAKKIAEEASIKLLANPVMEYFEITIV
jgi:phosphoribosylformylglycinamidine synthase subunit PurS